jgi:hypothetical protein
MIRSKYLTIIAIMLIVIINAIATVSCNNVATIVTTAKEKIGSFSKTQISLSNIGIVKGIYVGSEWVWHGWVQYEKHYFFVLVEPTNAKADEVYTVSLYVEEKLRQRNYVSWNQPELNVKTEKYVLFDLITENEWKAYSPKHSKPISYEGMPQSWQDELRSSFSTESLPSSICNATITLE